MTTRIVLAALLAALFLPSALVRADNPRLVGTVGRNDSFAISLSDASGSPVTHLDPGTYDVEIHDLSEEPGIYSYRSDKHKNMRGSLVVTLPF